MRQLSFFLTGLALIYITLKLTHVIAWSWWWVLAPLWAPLALFGLFIIAVFVVLGVAAWCGADLRLKGVTRV